jgi:ABC-2 type transport system ATP-binding protein
MLWEVVLGYKEQGGSLLLTTHYMDEAERLCDRLAIMDRGKVIARGSPLELIASLGLEHVVEFSTAAVDRIDVDALRRLDGVRDARAENGTVRLQATALHRVLPTLLDELSRQALPLTELRTRSATLEDVFVALTGRHLRDE